MPATPLPEHHHSYTCLTRRGDTGECFAYCRCGDKLPTGEALVLSCLTEDQLASWSQDKSRTLWVGTEIRDVLSQNFQWGDRVFVAHRR